MKDLRRRKSNPFSCSNIVSIKLPSFFLETLGTEGGCLLGLRSVFIQLYIRFMLPCRSFVILFICFTLPTYAWKWKSKVYVVFVPRHIVPSDRHCLQEATSRPSPWYVLEEATLK